MNKISYELHIPRDIMSATGRLVPTRNIAFVQFGTLTAEEWERYAVVEIDKPLQRGTSLDGTPYDPRLGVLENGKICMYSECGLYNNECPGHFGYIRLPEPVVNPEFVKYIVRLLKCVCVECGNPRISKVEFGSSKSLKYSARLTSFQKRSEKIPICRSCGKLLPIIKEVNSKIKAIYDGGDKPISEELTARKILKLFTLITNDTLEFLGFNSGLSENSIFVNNDIAVSDNDKLHIHQTRPESMIITILPVIPVSCRPWVNRDGEKKDDDLTDKYNSILKVCQKLREDGKPRKRIRAKLTDSEKERYIEELKQHVWTLIDNKKQRSLVSNGGRAHKGLKDRLSKKEGQIQISIAGKRVDFSARDVIIPGGNLLRIDEVGIPSLVREIETIKEPVTQFNISVLKKLVDEGKVNRIISRGRVIDLKNFSGKPPELCIRDIVERQLNDGDCIPFNRQPTLRVESMMGVKVKATDGYAFRLPLALTTAFNADYDGDECNIHVPQSIQARTECSIIMNVQQHVMTAQSNSPIIGAVQDAPLCTYILTRGEFGECISINTFLDALSSARIPIERFNSVLGRAKRYYDDIDVSIHIPGKLVFSVLFPAGFCYKKRSDSGTVIIDDGIITPQSAPVCKKVVGGCKNSIIHFMWKNYGPKASVDFISELQFITDYILPLRGFTISLGDCITTEKELIAKTLSQASAEAMNCTEERKVCAILNGAMSIAPKLAQTSMNKGNLNSLTIMKLSGAKGNDVNTSSIAAFLGQQNIEGKRVPCTLSRGTRALPYFKPNDNSPEARGFVFHSYLEGLSISEVFFHAMAGRKGVIDTSIKTADSGYISKKLNKKLEDMKVYIDGSVRIGNNDIVQFLYGEDGMNAKHLIYTDRLDFPFFVEPISISESLNREYERTTEFIPMQSPKKLTKTQLSAFLRYITAGVCENSITAIATKNLQSALAESVKNVVLYPSIVPKFCRIVRDMLEKSKACNGYMCGLVATSSIGEPTTQLVLRTFHFTGNSEKDVTLGLPHLKEMLNATKKPSKPSCTIYFRDYDMNNKLNDAQKQQFMIKYKKELITKGLCIEELTVSKLLKDTELRYVNKIGVPILDFIPYAKYVKEWWCDESFEPDGWVQILKFDTRLLFKYNITLKSISDKICERCDDALCVTHSPLCMGEIHLYIKEEHVQITESYFEVSRATLDTWIPKILVRGVKGIKKTYVENDHIETDGSNLRDVLSIPSVDTNKTFSSNMWEICSIFGIEAARAWLLQEIEKVVGFDGTYVNRRHYQLLADAMTRTGTITSVNRDGIGNCSLIARGMFEKSIDIFSHAAVFAERDSMNSVASSVMFGATAQIGGSTARIKDMC